MAILTAIFRGRLVRRLLAAGCALAVLAGARAAEPAAPTPEYGVKAAFLFNFAQFVEWPAAAFADEKAPLVIGIVGKDPFGAYLDNLVKDEKIGEHPIVVRRFPGEENLTECHMLFISPPAAAHLDQILAQLKGRGVLTVADIDNFCRLGGMVRFVTENGKIRLRINVTGAQAAGLTISSKLLRWATIVTPEKG